MLKAEEVWGRLSGAGSDGDSGGAPDVVVASDSVVEVDGHVLEKPASAEEARGMLHRLSAARVHRVHSGVAVLFRPRGGAGAPQGGGTRPPILLRRFAETTEVSFAHLSPALIDAYIATGEPFDKAGACERGWGG